MGDEAYEPDPSSWMPSEGSEFDPHGGEDFDSNSEPEQPATTDGESTREQAEISTQKPTENPDRPFKCNHCTKDYKCRSDLNKHNRSSVCARVNRTYRTGLRSRKVRSPSRSESDVKSLESTPGLWDCPRCQQNFYSENLASRHIRETCWKVCDQCCENGTKKTCNARRLTGPSDSCSNCVGRGTECTRLTEHVAGCKATHRFVSSDTDVEPGPNPRHRKRKVDGSRDASPESHPPRAKRQLYEDDTPTPDLTSDGSDDSDPDFISENPTISRRARPVISVVATSSLAPTQTNSEAIRLRNKLTPFERMGKGHPYIPGSMPQERKALRKKALHRSTSKEVAKVESEVPAKVSGPPIGLFPAPTPTGLQRKSATRHAEPTPRVALPSVDPRVLAIDRQPRTTPAHANRDRSIPFSNGGLGMDVLQAPTYHQPLRRVSGPLQQLPNNYGGLYEHRRATFPQSLSYSRPILPFDISTPPFGAGPRQGQYVKTDYGNNPFHRRPSYDMTHMVGKENIDPNSQNIRQAMFNQARYASAVRQSMNNMQNTTTAAINRPSHPKIGTPSDPVLTIYIATLDRTETGKPNCYDTIHIRKSQKFGPELQYYCAIRDKKYRQDWNFVFWHRNPTADNELNERGSVIKYKETPQSYANIRTVYGDYVGMRDGSVIEIIEENAVHDAFVEEEVTQRVVHDNVQPAGGIKAAEIAAFQKVHMEHKKMCAEAAKLRSENEAFRIENMALHQEVACLRNTEIERNRQADTNEAENSIDDSDRDEKESGAGTTVAVTNAGNTLISPVSPPSDA